MHVYSRSYQCYLTVSCINAFIQCCVTGVTSNEDKRFPVEVTDKTVKVTGYKRTMVKTMTKSGRIPQFGYCDEVRMDALIKQVMLFSQLYHIVGFICEA